MASKYVSPEGKDLFTNLMICACSEQARKNDLPLAAMVACGLVESAYGGSGIYSYTHCPFNLQRRQTDKHVTCETILLYTCIKTDAAGHCIGWSKSPITFCKAKGDYEYAWLGDAARIWCEWILGWPNDEVRKHALALRHWPVDFARYLPHLGFGEMSKMAQNGETFAAVVRQRRLVERCANGACYYA